MKLTEKQIIDIMKHNRISECTKAQRKQVMIFAFGNDYMDSNDKGSKKQITEEVQNGKFIILCNSTTLRGGRLYGLNSLY